MIRKDSIKNTVYEHRVLRRMSQQELAQLAGVSKQTIYLMERGDYSPSLLLAFRLARIFEADITNLFHYKEN
ncbi:MAG TPA: helix-turn-helix transcriptional regulator [Candidatus Saccharimonadales bacterium]